MARPSGRRGSPELRRLACGRAPLSAQEGARRAGSVALRSTSGTSSRTRRRACCEAAAEHPRALAACLVAGLRDTRARGREVSAWTAGAARAAGTRHALREALDDRVPRVRMAAAWALGRLRD